MLSWPRAVMEWVKLKDGEKGRTVRGGLGEGVQCNAWSARGSKKWVSQA